MISLLNQAKYQIFVKYKKCIQLNSFKISINLVFKQLLIVIHTVPSERFAACFLLWQGNDKLPPIFLFLKKNSSNHSEDVALYMNCQGKYTARKSAGCG